MLEEVASSDAANDVGYRKLVAGATERVPDIIFGPAKHGYDRGYHPARRTNEAATLCWYGDSIRAVNDTTLCRRASESFRREQFGADTGTLIPVHLIRYDSTRYVTSNLRRMGEWTNWAVMDSSFTILAAVGWRVAAHRQTAAQPTSGAADHVPHLIVATKPCSI